VKRRGHSRRPARVIAVICVIGIASAAAESRDGVAAGLGAAQRPPNFLLILVDDQAQNTFKPRFMPRTFHDIVDRGTRFTNAIAAPPLCCPDRAGILTGQYPHNHGVFSNHPGYADLRDPQNTLPVWLQNSGYRTGLFGKFMNHYSEVAGAAPAPGFDRWFAFLDGGSIYFDYGVSDDGTVRRYGHRRRAYSTDVMTQKTRYFIRRSASGSRPFFAWLGYPAPHVQHVAAGRCQGQNPLPPGRAAYRRFRRARLPRSPAFNERRVADKPGEIRALPRLQKPGIAEIERRWHCALGAIVEVDRQVGRLMKELRRDGERRQTIVIYLSDNGFFFGQHRLRVGKGFVYEPALNVPFAMRVPRAYRGSAASPSLNSIVSNQDIAPTLLDYVNSYGGSADSCVSPGDCRRIDGRTLQPLLGGAGQWRQKRGVLAEIDTRLTVMRNHPECLCAYHAIRTRRYVYSELAGGERELYDLRLDPEELRNKAGSAAYAEREQSLAARLDRLRQCSGLKGRDPPALVPYCK
jgi:N-acetylglucosamine-6-sulfatase